MIRAALDTNVFVSALRSQNGASFEIVARYRKGEFAMLLSQTVFAECEEVLKRELVPLGFTSFVIDRFLDAIASAAIQFKTCAFWKPSLPDSDDEALAQLAMEA
jgi:predicted nucleic acid-binding protein